MNIVNNLRKYLLQYQKYRSRKEIEGNLVLKDGGLRIRKDPRLDFVGDVNDEKRVFDLRDIEEAVRDAVCELNAKGIYTYYSEAGGKGHSIEDYSYIVARLTPENARTAEQNGFLLKNICYNNRDPLKTFNYQDMTRTNFYVLGFNREDLSDKEAGRKFYSLVDRLKIQEDDLKGRGKGFRREEQHETSQYLSIMKV